MNQRNIMGQVPIGLVGLLPVDPAQPCGQMVDGCQVERSKIVALEGQLDQADFGLIPCTLEEMRRSVSLIIHTAWSVNFTLPLASFESHMRGLCNLINFAQSVNASTPAVALFCSSISSILASPVSEVAETLLGIKSALSIGYSQSTWAGEQIARRSRSVGAHTYSLRIGQIPGHCQWNLWSDSEAIPLVVRSALTLGVLPVMDTSCASLV